MQCDWMRNVFHVILFTFIFFISTSIICQTIAIQSELLAAKVAKKYIYKILQLRIGKYVVHQANDVDLAISTNTRIFNFSMRKMSLRNAVSFISAWGCCFRIVIMLNLVTENAWQNKLCKRKKKNGQRKKVTCIKRTMWEQSQWLGAISLVEFISKWIDRIAFFVLFQFIPMSIWIHNFFGCEVRNAPFPDPNLKIRKPKTANSEHGAFFVFVCLN